jgi:hypothetical protein
VGRPVLPPGPLPSSIDLPVLRDAHMPSHVLAVIQSERSSRGGTSILIPIDATLYDRGFRTELSLPQPPPGSLAPVPRAVSSSVSPTRMAVTVPLISLELPHLSSLPLLLLFGLGLETQPNLLAYRLLPASVVYEFPDAAMMSSQLAQECTNEDFIPIYDRNCGIWRNSLSLGLKEGRIEEVIRLAWNVTGEARKLRSGRRPF